MMNVDDSTVIRQLCAAFVNEMHDSTINYRLSLSFDNINMELRVWVWVCRATVIMISSRLRDSSDGLGSISVPNDPKIPNKIFNLFSIKEFTRNSKKG